MRVALIGPSYPFRGGIAHYTTLLYRCLKSRHDVRFLSLKHQYPQWLYPGTSDRDGSAFTIQEEGAEHMLDPFDPLSWVRTGQAVRDFDPDCVILPWWVSLWAPAYLTIARIVKARARMLFLVHDVFPHEVHIYDQWLARHVLAQGDAFIVHSAVGEEKLHKLVPGAKVRRTVHPTYEVFRQAQISQAEARARIGAAGDMLLFFGLVRPYKGLNDLIAALPRIVEKRPLQLWIVGEFWQDEGVFRRQIADLGMERWVRMINRYVPNEQVGLYFSAADAVILPYTSGMGSGVAQIAFGHEKPVVATRVGDLLEVIEDGITGMLTPSHDPAALAGAALAIYDKSGEEWAAAIRARRERFSWERLAECIEELAAEVGA
jgi:glycosyltransferase involved in cell wall biosynthesis